MPTINFTSRFKRDWKREKAGQHGPKLDALIAPVLKALEAGKLLPPQYRDHALSGQWPDCRDCHLKPDLVLIYRHVEGGQEVDLVRLGSHSELGL